MLSGSRNCLRVPKKIQSCNGVPLHQPLLFLYTRWFTNQEHLNPHDRSAHAPLKQDDNSLIETPSDPLKSEQIVVEEHSDFQRVSLRPSQELPQAQATASQDRDIITEYRELEAIIDKRRARQGLVVWEQRADGQEHRAYFPAPGSTSSTSHQDQWRPQNRSVFSEDSRWQTALGLLTNLVPPSRKAEGESIWLSKSTLLILSGTSNVNSWVHPIRGGCEVQVTDDQSSTGTARRVLLRGPPRAVALSKEHFLSLEKTDGGQQEVAECESTGPFRYVLSEDKSRRDLRAIDTLPRPNANSLSSLLHSVVDLTSMQTPRLVRRERYGSRDKRQNKVVADDLCGLFTEPTTGHFVSAVALDRAMAFLCKHSELGHQIRKLYNQWRRSRLTLLPSTYSYVLQAMLCENDMRSFHHVLDDLHIAGQVPGCQVWLALLKSESSLKQKIVVADWMSRKELLGTPFVRGQVAAEIANAELRETDDHQAHPARFVGSIDARFGNDWMAESSVAQILRVCADIKAWTIADEIFSKAQKRNVIFGPAIAPVILTMMKRRGSLKDSLDLLRSHFVKTIGRDDSILIPIVFLTAWRRRFYNVCRVLWRYAAVQGITTYKMQSRITESLLRNHDVSISSEKPGKLTEGADRWWRQAGKIIAGIDLDITGYEKSFNLIERARKSESANPMVWLAHYTADDEPRDQQISLAYVILNHDLGAWKTFARPHSERLFNLLSEAYAMDVRWRTEGVGLDRGGKSTQWMIENAIEVRLVRREISLSSTLTH